MKSEPARLVGISLDFVGIPPTVPHINSETNPPTPIINIVCKYLRHFLGTSFGVATLPTYCSIE